MAGENNIRLIGVDDAGLPRRSESRFKDELDLRRIVVGSVTFAIAGPVNFEGVLDGGYNFDGGLAIVQHTQYTKPFYFCKAGDDSGTDGYPHNNDNMMEFYAVAYDTDNDGFSPTPSGGVVVTAADDHAAGYFPVQIQLAANLWSNFFFLQLIDATTGSDYPKVDLYSGGNHPRGSRTYVMTGSGPVAVSDLTGYQSAASSGDQTLLTVTIPGSASGGLSKDGDYATARGTYTFAAGALVTADVSVKVGSTVVAASGAALNASNGTYVIEVEIKRQDATHAYVTAKKFPGNALFSNTLLSEWNAVASGVDFDAGVGVEFHCNLSGSGFVAGDVTLVDADLTLHRQGD